MNKEEVGKRIKSFMKENSITQMQLSEKLGMSQSYISSMVSGQRNTLQLAELIADNYDVDLGWLINGDKVGEDVKIDAKASQYTANLAKMFIAYIENERKCKALEEENERILKQISTLYDVMRGNVG